MRCRPNAAHISDKGGPTRYSGACAPLCPWKYAFSGLLLERGRKNDARHSTPTVRNYQKCSSCARLEHVSHHALKFVTVLGVGSQNVSYRANVLFYRGAVQISIEGVWQDSSAHARPEGLRTRRFRGYCSGGVEKTTAPTSTREVKNMANMTCRKMRYSAHSRHISETACDF